MLLTRSAQYSLRAMLHLARQPAGRYVMTRDIAHALDLPPHFLAKLMQPMSHCGWLDTARGRFGGIALTEAARAMPLLTVIEQLGLPGRGRDCLLGLKDCDDATACVLHCQWQPIRRELRDYLANNSVAQVAEDDASEQLIGRLGLTD